MKNKYRLKSFKFNLETIAAIRVIAKITKCPTQVAVVQMAIESLLQRLSYLFPYATAEKIEQLFLQELEVVELPNDRPGRPARPRLS